MNEPAPLKSRIISEFASFTLGSVALTAAIEANGDLLLSIGSASNTVRYQCAFLKRRETFDIGSWGALQRIDDPTVAPRHVRVHFREDAHDPAYRKLSVGLTVLTDWPTTIAGQEAAQGSEWPLLTRTVPVQSK